MVKLSNDNGVWNTTVLHAFDGSDGEFASGSVVLDGTGNIYGTTFDGTSDYYGVIYEITPQQGSLSR